MITENRIELKIYFHKDDYVKMNKFYKYLMRYAKREKLHYDLQWETNDIIEEE